MGAPLSPEVIRPQAGPQEAFLASPADIIIYGGSAGSGKSWAVLLEPLRHVVTNKAFKAVFFRRNAVQIRNPGGLWDESMSLYPKAGGIPVSQPMEWRWRGGGRIKFAHLEHENTVLDWQGAQIPLIVFDELTHFSKAQFFYMMSRNRSMSGVPGYIRATTNPDADSWVAEFIAWWIDQDTGYAIPERSGVVRWFIRVSDEVVWGDTREELIEQYGDASLPIDSEEQPVIPKSFTFIAATLADNPALMKKDPSYKGNLLAMSRVERERLFGDSKLGGNWKIRPAAGLYFRKHEVTILETLPDDVVTWVRRWDLAATEKAENNPDPDWTAGVLIGKRANGRYIFADVIRVRKKANAVRELVMRTANNDGHLVKIGLSQDPGQAGKDQVESYVQMLAGYSAFVFRETGDKVVRAEPLAAQWQAGNIDILKGAWNSAFFDELEAFPTKGVHDDQVDGASGGFFMLTKARNIYDSTE